ncbi:hypothetical protein PM027_21790, partial [[Clostridium] symbiosum]|uniref:hypothetical protein n=1 Tax=Clostridium symbiosum TaxID=1512 RepID=UPI001A9A9AD7
KSKYQLCRSKLHQTNGEWNLLFHFSIDRKQLFMFDNYPRQMVEFQYKQIPYTSVLKNLLQEKF